MPQNQMVRDLLPFRREINAPAAPDAKIAPASHALQRRGNGGRSDAKILGETRADWHLFLLDEFPDGFQVVFLRYAGFLAAQVFYDSSAYECNCVVSWSARRARGLFRCAGMVFRAETRGQIRDARFDIIADAAVGCQIVAVGIFHIPIFEIVIAEFAAAVIARHVDDQVRLEANDFTEAFRRLAVGSDSAFCEHRARRRCHETQRRETRAGDFHRVASRVARERFRHLTAARIADADEEHFGWDSHLPTIRCGRVSERIREPWCRRSTQDEMWTQECALA